MQETNDVVTSFVVKKSELLLLKRSDEVNTFPGRWAGVSGYREDNPPRRQALREIYQETRIKESQLELSAQGKTLLVSGETAHGFRVFPFKFRLTGKVEIKLNWENSELRWCKPGVIKELETVPDLYKAWRRVADGG